MQVEDAVVAGVDERTAGREGADVVADGHDGGGGACGGDDLLAAEGGANAVNVEDGSRAVADGEGVGERREAVLADGEAGCGGCEVLAEDGDGGRSSRRL